MFCNACGTQLPDESRFCLKCGNTLPATGTATSGTGAAAAPAAAPEATLTAAPAPSPTDDRQRSRDLIEPEPKRRIAIWILVPLLAVAIGYLIYSLNSGTPQGGTPLQKLAATEYTEKLPEEHFSVNALGGNSTKFEVPPGAFNVRAEGNFSVEGGSGNDIEVFIFDEDGFANWQNRHAATPYYSSGRATRGTINVTLPGPGTYVVVFSNKFSIMSSKEVEAHVTVRYSK